MHFDLDFLFPGLLGFWQVDLPFKGTAVPFNKEVVLILLLLPLITSSQLLFIYRIPTSGPMRYRCGFAFNKGFLLYKK